MVTDPVFPVRHGIVISLSCDIDFSNKGGDKATCHDGQLEIAETANLPDCRGETESINNDFDQNWLMKIEDGKLNSYL